jgi:anti-sigma-K factor RskA
MNAQARRYDVSGGQVVASNDRLYILLQGTSMPPRGKVYQAWTLARGAQLMTPSVTFIPDAHGLVVAALPDVDATRTSAVAVSVEPESGSRQPTTTLIFDASL